MPDSIHSSRAALANMHGTDVVQSATGQLQPNLPVAPHRQGQSAVPTSPGGSLPAFSSQSGMRINHPDIRKFMNDRESAIRLPPNTQQREEIVATSGVSLTSREIVRNLPDGAAISLLTPKSLSDAIVEMSSNEEAWRLVPPSTQPDIDTVESDWATPKRTWQEIANLRSSNGQSVLKGIQSGLDWMDSFEQDSDAVFAIRTGAQTEGLLYLHNDDEYPDLSDLVTLPGTKGNGKALVEQAVRQSNAWGMGGKLRTIPMDLSARKFYEAIGFAGEGIMYLDPRSSDKWQIDENGALTLIERLSNQRRE